MIVDDMGIYHHVNLYKNQIELLEAFYNNQKQEVVQLLHQDWSKYICIARGRKKLIEVKERKSRSNSKESQQVHQLFQPEQETRKFQIEKRQQIIEERLSDQDSQRSRGQKKEKQMDNKEVVASVWFVQNQGNRLIEEIDRALSLAQTVDDKDIDILPKEIFPEGITKFVEQFGAGNYLKLFLKLNYEYLISPTRKTRDAYFKDRAFEWEGIRREIINDFKFQKQTEQMTIEQLVIGCYGFLDAFYDSSEIIIYAKAENLNEFVVMELRLYHLGEWMRYYKVFTDQYLVEIKKIIVKVNKILRGFGLARLSIDQFMICPFCTKVWDKVEIFKHFCEVSVGLTIKRGRRQ